MSLTAGDILDLASELLGDQAKILHPDALLLEFLNDGQRAIVSTVPEAGARAAVAHLESGIYQVFPSAGQRLLDMPQNVSGLAQLAIAATDADKNEGDTGTTSFVFTVTRTGNTSGTASADWAVTGSGANPATASDFVGGALPTGTVSLSDGEASKTISVPVQGDITLESDDTFTVTLSNPVNAFLVTATAPGTIRTDDLCNYSISKKYDTSQPIPTAQGITIGWRGADFLEIDSDGGVLIAGISGDPNSGVNSNPHFTDFGIDGVTFPMPGTTAARYKINPSTGALISISGFDWVGLPGAIHESCYIVGKLGGNYVTIEFGDGIAGPLFNADEGASRIVDATTGTTLRWIFCGLSSGLNPLLNMQWHQDNTQRSLVGMAFASDGGSVLVFSVDQYNSGTNATGWRLDIIDTSLTVVRTVNYVSNPFTMRIPSASSWRPLPNLASRAMAYDAELNRLWIYNPEDNGYAGWRCVRCAQFSADFSTLTDLGNYEAPLTSLNFRPRPIVKNGVFYVQMENRLIGFTKCEIA
jgi:hypothetical protein